MISPTTMVVVGSEWSPLPNGWYIESLDYFNDYIKVVVSFGIKVLCARIDA